MKQNKAAAVDLLMACVFTEKDLFTFNYPAH